MTSIKHVEFFPDGVYYGSHTVGEVFYRADRALIACRICINDGIQIFVKDLTGIDTSSEEFMVDVAKMDISEQLYRTYRDMAHLIEYVI